MYRVVGWADNFENNRTRELKALAWVPFPNKHDGDGYTELLDHEEGAAHYGCWCAIVQVASKCDPRGTLLRDGARPHDAASLARMTRIPEAVMKRAIARLLIPVRWLEVVPDPVVPIAVTRMPHGHAVIPQAGAEKRLRMEANGSEGKDLSSNRDRSARTIGKPLEDQPSGSSPSRMDASGSEEEAGAVDLSRVDWAAVLAMAEAVGKRVPARSIKDRRGWFKFAVMADMTFGEAWLVEAADAVVNAKNTKRSKQAHFVGILKRKAAEHQDGMANFEALLKGIEIPDSVWHSSVLEVLK